MELPERLPDDGPMDETDINLRSYFCRWPAARFAEYDAAWSDEALMAWDGNFCHDGTLFLICCERDVEVAEYRRVLEKYCKLVGVNFSSRAGSSNSGNCV